MYSDNTDPALAQNAEVMENNALPVHSTSVFDPNGSDNGGDGQQPVVRTRPHPNEIDNPCKVFVGGLAQHTTEQDLREYMLQFGVVTFCKVMMEKSTGRSRGFGFVTFTDSRSVDMCLHYPHRIQGTLVEVRRAVPRSDTPENHEEMHLKSKIFVGGIPEEVSEGELAMFFSERFGAVKSAQLILDRWTGRPKGFGFVYFMYDHSAENAVGVHQLRGKKIEAKKAVPQQEKREKNSSDNSDLRLGEDGNGDSSNPRTDSSTGHGGSRRSSLQSGAYSRGGQGYMGGLPRWQGDDRSQQGNMYNPMVGSVAGGVPYRDPYYMGPGVAPNQDAYSAAPHPHAMQMRAPYYTSPASGMYWNGGFENNCGAVTNQPYQKPQTHFTDSGRSANTDVYQYDGNSATQAYSARFDFADRPSAHRVNRNSKVQPY